MKFSGFKSLAHAEHCTQKILPLLKHVLSISESVQHSQETFHDFHVPVCKSIQHFPSPFPQTHSHRRAARCTMALLWQCATAPKTCRITTWTTGSLRRVASASASNSSPPSQSSMIKYRKPGPHEKIRIKRERWKQVAKFAQQTPSETTSQSSVQNPCYIPLSLLIDRGSF